MESKKRSWRDRRNAAVENMKSRIEVEESLEDKVDRKERADDVVQNRNLKDWLFYHGTDLAALGGGWATYSMMTVGLEGIMHPTSVIGDMPSAAGIILALTTRGASPRYRVEVNEAMALYEKPMHGFFSRIGGKRFAKGLGLGLGFFAIHSAARMFGLDPDFYNLTIDQAAALGGVGGIADIGLTYLQGRRYSKRAEHIAEEKHDG